MSSSAPATFRLIDPTILHQDASFGYERNLVNLSYFANPSFGALGFGFSANLSAFVTVGFWLDVRLPSAVRDFTIDLVDPFIADQVLSVGETVTFHTWSSRFSGYTFQSQLDMSDIGFDMGLDVSLAGGITNIELRRPLWDDIRLAGFEVDHRMTINLFGFDLFADEGEHFSGIGSDYLNEKVPVDSILSGTWPVPQMPLTLGWNFRDLGFSDAEPVRAEYGHSGSPDFSELRASEAVLAYAELDLTDLVGQVLFPGVGVPLLSPFEYHLEFNPSDYLFGYFDHDLTLLATFIDLDLRLGIELVQRTDFVSDRTWVRAWDGDVLMAEANRGDTLRFDGRDQTGVHTYHLEYGIDGRVVTDYGFRFVFDIPLKLLDVHLWEGELEFHVDGHGFTEPDIPEDAWGFTAYSQTFRIAESRFIPISAARQETAVSLTTDRIAVEVEFTDDPLVANSTSGQGGIRTHSSMQVFGPNVTFRGGPEDDMLAGFAGNDTLVASGGTDTLLGGAGDDLLVVALDNSTYGAALFGGAGTDRALIVVSETYWHNFDMYGPAVYRDGASYDFVFPQYDRETDNWTYWDHRDAGAPGYWGEPETQFEYQYWWSWGGLTQVYSDLDFTGLIRQGLASGGLEIGGVLISGVEGVDVDLSQVTADPSRQDLYYAPAKVFYMNGGLYLGTPGGGDHFVADWSDQGTGVAWDLRNNAAVTLANGVTVGGFEQVSLRLSDHGNRIVGGAGSDLVIGGAGADTLTAWAGSDTLVGGGGDDLFTVLPDAAFHGAHLFGGAGHDRALIVESGKAWHSFGSDSLYVYLDPGAAAEFSTDIVWSIDRAWDDPIAQNIGNVHGQVTSYSDLDFAGLVAAAQRSGALGLGGIIITGIEAVDVDLTQVADYAIGGGLRAYQPAKVFYMNGTSYFGTRGHQDHFIADWSGQSMGITWDLGSDGAVRLANGVTVGGFEQVSLRLSDHGNRVTGGAHSDLIIGGAGNDTLTATGGSDTLVGGAGNDIFIATSDFRSGGHVLFGGAGQDRATIIVAGTPYHGFTQEGPQLFFGTGSGSLDYSTDYHWYLHDQLGEPVTQYEYNHVHGFYQIYSDLEFAGLVTAALATGGLQLGQTMLVGVEAVDVDLSGVSSYMQWGHTTYQAAKVFYMNGASYLGTPGQADHFIADWSGQSVGITWDMRSLSPVTLANGVTIGGFEQVTLRLSDHGNRITAGNGNDIIIGGAGRDVIDGRDGDDYLVAGSGGAELYGGEGNDVLVSGAGNDAMAGGSGHDRYIFAPGTGSNEILDRDGGTIELRDLHPDTFTLSRLRSNLLLEADGVSINIIDFFANPGIWQVQLLEDHYPYWLEFETWNIYDATAHLAHPFDWMGRGATLGGDGDTNWRIFPIGQFIIGGAGTDLFNAGPGPDALDGGGGRNAVSYHLSTEGVHLSLLQGRGYAGYASGDRYMNIQMVAGSDHDDWIVGGTDDDIINGGAGDDIIRGEGGNDTLRGGAGDDDIGGGAGDDLIHGDGGNDIIWGGAGSDTVYGGTGNDTIYGGGTGTNRLFGEDGNDVIHAGQGGDFIGGGAGNDTIRGGAGNDTIHGGLDDDNIGGGAGNDLIHGSAGANIIWGGAGDDTVQGGTGSDTIHGGGTGTNRLLGNDGNDLIFAGAGGDFIGGGAGNDTIRGGDGNDTIYGGTGNDDLAGGAGNDIIFGSAGNNIIWGGAGNDTIHAGTGRDVMNGGPGADVFVFASAAHIGIGASRDRISEFTPGVDRIDLSALNTQFNNAAGFIGGGQASFYHFASGGLLIGDQTGNGIADWVLELPGVASGIAARDFVL